MRIPWEWEFPFPCTPQCTVLPLGSSNINRFSKISHCQNQEKMCKNGAILGYSVYMPAKKKAMSPNTGLQQQKMQQANIMCPLYELTCCSLTGGRWVARTAGWCCCDWTNKTDTVLTGMRSRSGVTRRKRGAAPGDTLQGGDTRTKNTCGLTPEWN